MSGDEENEENLNSEHSPEYAEVIEVIKRLKNGKAPGEDTITTELIKNARSECHRKIYNLILKIWTTEEMSKEWRNGLIVPTHKKGNRLECINYRPITLLNVVYEILSKIINKKLKSYAEKCIIDYQCGFSQTDR